MISFSFLSDLKKKKENSGAFYCKRKKNDIFNNNFSLTDEFFSGNSTYISV